MTRFLHGFERGDRHEGIDARILSNEITRSEILRVKVLVIFFAIPGFYSVFMSLYPELFFTAAFIKQVNTAYFPLFFGSAVLYYGILWLAIRKFALQDRQLPKQGRIMNAIVEGALPTIALIVLFPGNDFAGGLSTPPIFFYAVFLILSVLRLEFFISLLTGIVAAAGYFSFAAYYIIGHDLSAETTVLYALSSHFSKSFFLLLSGLAAGFVGAQLRLRILDAFAHLRDKERVQTLFGEHVSPQVVQALLEKDANLSEEKEISVLFLDIRGFTSFSEKKTPTEVFTALNRLFEFMIEIIETHDGIINKFLGDGFLAVFGAPVEDRQHSRHAVAAALEILERLEEKKSRGEVADLDIGIGIHSGVALTGNVGSHKRREFTIIGDVVNLASRIEQLCKQLGARLLVSRNVYENLSDAGGEEVGTFAVKGRAEKVGIIRLR